MKMTAAKSFQDLIVWQKAHRFVLSVYKITKFFPKEETYGLTLQFRKAAVSIPANIAEGFKRRTQNDKARFLNIAQSSLEECRYYIILSKDLEYHNDQNLMEQLVEVSKLLNAYYRTLVEVR